MTVKGIRIETRTDGTIIRRALRPRGVLGTIVRSAKRVKDRIAMPPPIPPGIATSRSRNRDGGTVKVPSPTATPASITITQASTIARVEGSGVHLLLIQLLSTAT